MMKKYQILQETNIQIFETNLNDLAGNGWKVIASNIILNNLPEYGIIYYALLENTSLDTELKKLLEEYPEELEDLGDIAPSAN